MENELSRLAQAAVNAYTSNQPGEAEKLWQDAVDFAKKHDLVEALVRETMVIGDKQSLYGDFEKAGSKFDLAISMAKGKAAVPPAVVAALYAKAAANQANYDEKLAAKNFEIAVKQFESAGNRDELDFADCLNQYGRTLQGSKKLPESIDMHEKALVAYSKVTTLKPTDLDNRIRPVREFMLATAEKARGAKREELRSRVNKILGYGEHIPTPSLQEALKAMHEEGLETALTFAEANRLSPESDEEESDGAGRLLEALRARFEEHDDWNMRPNDSIIVYPMPFGVEDVQECFDYFCQRLGEKQWFKVLTAEDFGRVTIETGDGQKITIAEYGDVADIVNIINKWLKKKGDNRRFYQFDGAEDEGVFYLMTVAAQKRLAKKGVLPFEY